MTTETKQETITKEPQSQIVLQGWLMKQSPSRIFANWKKRWFEAQPPYLYYFKDIEMAESLGSIYIPNITSIKTVTSTSSRAKQTSFQIVIPTRTYNLRTETKQQCDDWIQQLKNLFNNSMAKKDVNPEIGEENIEFSGELFAYRKIKLHKTWYPCFCALREFPILFCYFDSNFSKVDQRIHLNKVTHIQNVPQDRFQKPNVFEIKSSNQSFFFQGNDFSTVQKWIQEIGKIIELYKSTSKLQSHKQLVRRSFSVTDSLRNQSTQKLPRQMSLDNLPDEFKTEPQIKSRLAQQIQSDNWNLDSQNDNNKTIEFLNFEEDSPLGEEPVVIYKQTPKLETPNPNDLSLDQAKGFFQIKKINNETSPPTKKKEENYEKVGENQILLKVSIPSIQSTKTVLVSANLTVQETKKLVAKKIHPPLSDNEVDSLFLVVPGSEDEERAPIFMLESEPLYSYQIDKQDYLELLDKFEAVQSGASNHLMIRINIPTKMVIKTIQFESTNKVADIKPILLKKKLCSQQEFVTHSFFVQPSSRFPIGCKMNDLLMISSYKLSATRDLIDFKFDDLQNEDAANLKKVLSNFGISGSLYFLLQFGHEWIRGFLNLQFPFLNVYSYLGAQDPVLSIYLSDVSVKRTLFDNGELLINKTRYHLVFENSQNEGPTNTTDSFYLDTDTEATPMVRVNKETLIDLGFCFEVTHGTQILIISCENKEQKRKWVEQITWATKLVDISKSIDMFGNLKKPSIQNPVRENENIQNSRKLQNQLEGYLLRLFTQENKEIWQKLWFSVKDDNLCCFTNKRDSEPLEFVPLTNIANIEIGKKYSKYKDLFTSFLINFESIKSIDPWVLLAKDITEQENWVRGLEILKYHMIFKEIDEEETQNLDDQLFHNMANQDSKQNPTIMNQILNSGNKTNHRDPQKDRLSFWKSIQNKTNENTNINSPKEPLKLEDSENVKISIGQSKSEEKISQYVQGIPWDYIKVGDKTHQILPLLHFDDKMMNCLIRSERISVIVNPQDIFRQRDRVLIQISPQLAMQQVEFSEDSVRQDCVYIAEVKRTGDIFEQIWEIFQWNGVNSSRIQRAKGSAILSEISNVEGSEMNEYLEKQNINTNINTNTNSNSNSNSNTNSNSNSNNMKNQNQEMFKNHILDSSLIKEKSEEKNIHRSSESTEESNTEDISNRESTSFNSSSLQRSMSFYPSKIHILTQNSDDCTAFWDLFNMNKPPTKYADQKTNSINPDEEPKLMRIYRIGKGKTRSIECIKEGRWDQISKCVLETSFCYVVDTKNELFIWMGNGANSSQRKLVVKFGKAIKLLLSRPSSCFSMIVIENKEHVLFKEKFYDFSTRFSNNLYSNLFDEMNKKKSTQNNEDNTIQKLSTDFCSNEVVSKVIKDFINRTENPLKKTTQETTQKKKIDAQKSNLCVWVINKETREIEEFDNEMYGHFFSNDNYLVFFEMNNKTYLVLWEGLDAIKIGHEALEKITQNPLVYTKYSDQPQEPDLQFIIKQQHEPEYFLQQFNNQIIIHKTTNRLGNPDNYMFHIKTRAQSSSTIVVEVDPISQWLNSEDCFVVQGDEFQFLWIGKFFDTKFLINGKRICLQLMGEPIDLTTSENEINEQLEQANFQIIYESHEPKEFWNLLNGKKEFLALDYDPHKEKQPRLFMFVSVTDSQQSLQKENLSKENDEIQTKTVQKTPIATKESRDVSNDTKPCYFNEIRDFMQDNLDEKNIYFLISKEGFLVWIGQHSKLTDLELLYIVCQEISTKHSQDVFFIWQFSEPIIFSRHFHGWSTSRFPEDRRQPPSIHSQNQLLTNSEFLFKKIEEQKSDTFSYEKLLIIATTLFDENYNLQDPSQDALIVKKLGFDFKSNEFYRNCLENYLSKLEFFEIFKMNFEDFQELKEEEKNLLKKKYYLL
ncbi:villin [Anaeramoeba ignava]|uniref:Villin n=1 Tax=Anaeramoeba ignava TaxID=1746090 RepID=A0A9Q0LD67_ANAIG|nr:villin [Anaeramoeba ignava]